MLGIDRILGLLMKNFLNVVLHGFVFSVLLLTGCASSYHVKTYPADAKVSIQNASTRKSYPLGTGSVRFDPKREFGSTFFLVVTKPGFRPKEIFVAPNAGGASDYIVTLSPNPKGSQFNPTLETEMNAYIQHKVDKMLSEAEEKMKKADEARRAVQADEIRLEMAQRTLDADKRLKVVEQTFDVYKDVLFSERFAHGPASFDRRRIDNAVDMVNRIQAKINEKKLSEASALIEKLLENDEYFSKGYALKGTVKYLEGKIPEAVTAWERATELNPNDAATKQFLAKLNQNPKNRQPASAASSPNTGGRKW